MRELEEEKKAEKDAQQRKVFAINIFIVNVNVITIIIVIIIRTT